MVCEELHVPDDDFLNLPSGETILITGDSLIVQFSGPRDVLSTSWLNGGYRKDLEAVFNHQIPLAACDECHENGGVCAYLAGVAASRSLGPVTACGLITRADMRNAVVMTARYHDLRVTAVVTAGIDKNGGRAGDPASYHEAGGKFVPVGGTINTILIIGADLPEYALTRAIMTVTEAKTAALQQLMARSIYSQGIATGSGTDMVVTVSNPSTPLYLTDAGTHAMLGELIAKVVIRATILALERETGLSPKSQHDVLVRLSRFGITAEDLWTAAIEAGELQRSDPAGKEQFLHYLIQWAQCPENVARAAAALHILDEEAWGLLQAGAAQETIIRILHDKDLERTASMDTPLGTVTDLLSRLAARGFEDQIADKRIFTGPDTLRPI
ncbi:MAG: adenosylcobinamide amidohydrolase [Methanoregula sp.]|jgi:adenosylcobinamide amidohydrolase|nr:adenosylcobinamide amidohydrolase [Methanoregula sp.]